MNKCKYCNNVIPDKTTGGKPRTFCNKSCSRKHYIQNNPKKLKKSLEKSWETKHKILEKEPTYFKDRWVMTEKRKKMYNEFVDNGHMSKMGKLGYKAVCENGTFFGGTDKTKQILIKKGRWIDYSLFDYEDVKKYRSAIRRLTRKLYGNAGKGYHWDHIVPISKGFILNITPEIMCSQENIKKLKASDNLSKSNTLTEESIKILNSWGYKTDDLF